MVSQTSRYAIQALIYLCQQSDDGFYQTKEMARLLNVPTNYLGKTLQKLARERLVDSQKGLRGGFRIAKLPEQIRLFDILMAIDAIPRNLDQPEGGDAVNRIYIKFLRETTLAELMRGEGIEPATSAAAHLAGVT